ncbi:MAG: ATP-binding cassette domain-containing protein, partial [Thermodesulfobacteriota bacterium]
LGSTGSGKSALARAVKGAVPIVRGKLIRHDPEAEGHRIGYVAFELQEEILLREDRHEEARFFSGNKGHALTAGELLLRDNGNSAVIGHLAEQLGLSPLLEKGLRALSNGEFRKILIARALLPSPKLLILDDPFAGLDAGNRDLLAATVDDLIHHGTQIILVTQRIEELVPGISHVLLIQDGRVVRKGRRGRIITPEGMASFLPPGTPPPDMALKTPPEPPGRHVKKSTADPLVEMRRVTVAYGELVVLKELNWTVRRGENWAVVGPNGSGKTTLLGMITGDNLQAYANDISLFGKRRGEGESIWDIRRRLGVVSPELQLQYRHPLPAREVILSGFFDSIGLYRKSSGAQVALADQWLDFLDMQDRAERSFNRLSYGEKRLVLIARAMVKSPELLILDEPCQGLDRSNREKVLALMQRIGSGGATGLIYITHHPEELIPCISHILQLRKAAPAVAGPVAGAAGLGMQAQAPRKASP